MKRTVTTITTVTVPPVAPPVALTAVVRAESAGRGDIFVALVLRFETEWRGRLNGNKNVAAPFSAPPQTVELSLPLENNDFPKLRFN